MVGRPLSASRTNGGNAHVQQAEQNAQASPSRGGGLGARFAFLGLVETSRGVAGGGQKLLPPSNTHSEKCRWGGRAGSHPTEIARIPLTASTSASEPN